MADIESLLNRWQSAGVLDAEDAARIHAWEQEQQNSGSLRWQGLRWQGLVALILGAILLACGVVLFVSAHWDQLSPGWRFTSVIALVAVFHLTGAWTRKSFGLLSTTLHAVGTVSTGAALALVGQIFNIHEHWPTAVLLWALAALAGWILLRDQAQQTLALLLIPAWIFSELEFYSERHLGQDVLLGRFLVVWAVMFLTMSLKSRRAVVQGVLFSASAIALVAGAEFMLDRWSVEPWANAHGFSFQFWSWILIAALPLFLSLFGFRRSFVPVAASVGFALALPWCVHQARDFRGCFDGPCLRTAPSLLAHILVAAFAVFLAWWGVRQSSRALVNLGIAGFGLAVAWFYFSDIFNTVGRALGLIGLGILFLAGGWALDKARHRLLGHIGKARPPAAEVQ